MGQGLRRFRAGGGPLAAGSRLPAVLAPRRPQESRFGRHSPLATEADAFMGWIRLGGPEGTGD